MSNDETHHLVDPDHRCESRRACPHEVVEIVRLIAFHDVGVESEGDTLQEILQDIYAQGGSDGLSGLQAMAQVIGPDLTGAVLGVDWLSSAPRADATKSAGDEPGSPD